MTKINFKKNLKIVILTTLLLASFFYNASAGDQIKYHEFFVASFNEPVSSMVNLPFSFYIGDDLTGVSTPIKGAFFSVSGVYTGGGSLQLKIDSVTGSTKIFTLPTVSGPTDFNIVYQDETGVLNHTSAGTYGHTLNVTPTGITISGLGVKLETTHQFAPTSCVDGLPANEKIKVSEFFVGSFTNSLNGGSEYITLLPFSIYIGDNITGVTDPIKSSYFSISGVYTGGGTLDLTASSDGSGTSTRFTLPNVSNPTNFEFIYPDIYKYISPTSAGLYDYNLKIDLIGPTISNFSAKEIITHRYKPTDCGAGYPPYGELISAIYESTSNAAGPAYNSITWKGQLGGAEFNQGKVLFQVAASSNPSGPWGYVGGSTCGANDWYEATADSAIELACISDFNNKRYFRYKIRICSDDCINGGQNTPQVDDVIVNWSP